MKITITALVAALATAADAYNFTDTATAKAFNDFQKKFGKTYKDEEIAFRQGVFATNYARALADNDAAMELGHDAVHGVTKFMDLTPTEFKNTYLMPNYKSMPRISERHYKSVGNTTSIDWRQKGATTDVKDQGQCGSCWAFSATEAIESYNFLNGGKLEELSPQQINSCDKTDDGCNGGNTETAYEYVQSAGGIETGDSYPYTSGSGSTGMCKFKASNVAVSINGYQSIGQGEDNLAAALADGPVSVCLAANSFQTYTSGVLKWCPGQIDHCVQAVGFTDEYWIVRNSWAADWGEDGFIRLARGHNICKISNDVTYPTFASTEK